MKKQTKGIEMDKNRDQIEYQIHIANEVLGNLEQSIENIEEEKIQA